MTEEPTPPYSDCQCRGTRNRLHHLRPRRRFACTHPKRCGGNSLRGLIGDHGSHLQPQKTPRFTCILPYRVTQVLLGIPPSNSAFFGAPTPGSRSPADSGSFVWRPPLVLSGKAATSYHTTFATCQRPRNSQSPPHSGRGPAFSNCPVLKNPTHREFKNRKVIDEY